MADARDSKSRPPLAQLLDSSNPYADSAERLSALLGAFGAEITPLDAELARLLTAWPTLAEPVKAAIVGLASKTAKKHGDAGDGLAEPD